MTTENLKDQARLVSDEQIEATDEATPSESQGPADCSNQKSQESPSEGRSTLRSVLLLKVLGSQVEVLAPKPSPE